MLAPSMDTLRVRNTQHIIQYRNGNRNLTIHLKLQFQKCNNQKNYMVNTNFFLYWNANTRIFAHG